VQTGYPRLGRLAPVLAIAALVCAQQARPGAQPVDPFSLVDPFIGTLGNGHTFPGADVPFGMVQFSPVTLAGGPGGYDYGESRIRGFALTRLSGAGCTNYGDVPLMPAIAPPTESPATHPWAFTAVFNHDQESARPGFYRVGLGTGISAELGATPRTGLGVFTYPAGDPDGTLLVDASGSANAGTSTVRVIGNSHIVGSVTSAAFGGACGHPQGRYTVYFAIAFDRPFERFGVWSAARLAPGVRDESGPRVGAYARFATGTGSVVAAKAAISFVSVAGALRNLRAEATTWSIATVEARAQARWAALLDRIRVSGGAHADQVSFYTALYHSLLQPSTFSDVDGRYMGEDGRVHRAAGYTQFANFSGWDMYRGEMQLLALVAPRAAGDMIRSLVADGRQTGGLPKWLVANAETGLMVGDPADAIIADAYAFGARRFNAGLALQQMLAAAEDPERPGLGAFLSRGYVPASPSSTLEYAIADFAISQLAGALGDRRAQASMLKRAANWKQTFDSRTGFVEPRLGTGGFPRGISPSSSIDFVEGNAWQYTFMVPQDMAGLLASIGPPRKARERLDSFFARLNAGPSAPHAWLGNEPSFFAPYAYLWLGAPALSESVVSRALATLFLPQPNGLPGNDDLGALSAWYVWSALGLYPVIPGVAGFAVVHPHFPAVSVVLPGSSTLRLTAGGVTAGAFIRAVSLDSRPYQSSWLPYSRIARGGRLDFTLGPRPSSWGTAPGSGPPSFGS
jgi:predicted alpha-1,2-mannosidase